MDIPPIFVATGSPGYCIHCGYLLTLHEDPYEDLCYYCENDIAHCHLNIDDGPTIELWDK